MLSRTVEKLTKWLLGKSNRDTEKAAKYLQNNIYIYIYINLKAI